jgi:titin
MWTEGAQNGGTPVLDYTLQYDQGTSTWITYQSGITVTQITVTGLTQGVTYKFKILARNGYGSSAYSSELAILAAQMPDKPNIPATSVDGQNVKVSWAAPNNAGSAILGYRVYIRQSDLSTFSLEMTSCNGAEVNIRDAAECLIPI